MNDTLSPLPLLSLSSAESAFSSCFVLLFCPVLFCFVLFFFLLFLDGCCFDLILLFPGEGVLIHLVVRVDKVHLQSLLDVVAELVVILLPESSIHTFLTV